jgi:phosphoglucan,water dikinase
VKEVVDYSTQALSTDSEYRQRMGQCLATVGYFLEKHFGVPQDIEGCIIGKDVYIVQARPQP